MTGDSSEESVGDADPREDAASRERVDRLAAQYRQAGRPFALVTVVRREPPVSANVGDRAVVTPDGELTGWIGGADCAQSVAVKEAVAAIERDDPVLVGLAPDPDDVARQGLEAYPMTCHSGGVLELFVEPVTPAPRLVVVGESPIARALSRLAGETNFRVTVVAGPGTDPDPEQYAGAEAVLSADHAAMTAAMEGAVAVVVASVGEYDEAGLLAAIDAEVPYLGLVASGPRRDELADSVADRVDLDAATVLNRVTSPAGIDIGARTPEEIAVSVLAELVAVRRGASGAAPTAAVVPPKSPGGGDDHDAPDRTGEETTGSVAETQNVESAVDPVCGMTVAVAEAAATVTHGDETYYFCGEGCAEAFESDPGRYVEEVAVDD